VLTDWAANKAKRSLPDAIPPIIRCGQYELLAEILQSLHFIKNRSPFFLRQLAAESNSGNCILTRLYALIEIVPDKKPLIYQE
jgi:hypothetical protein